jgi:hypothetical protein
MRRASSASRDRARHADAEKSVFDERDIAKVLHRYVDDAGTFQHLMTRILQSPELPAARTSSASTSRPARRIPARYTTREMIRSKPRWQPRDLAFGQGSHGVREKVLEASLRAMSGCRTSRRRRSSM